MPNGSTERVDAILLATRYLPDVDYLASLGALDDTGRPRQTEGLSDTHPGLVYVGLDWQRSLSSATLRGVALDARWVVRRLRAHLRPASQAHALTSID